MAEEFMNIGEITPKSKNINIIFKVISIEDVRNVKSKKDRTPHAVTEAFIGDSTGCIYLTIWDEFIETIKVEKVFELTNSYASLFRGNIRINIGKYGELRELEDKEITVDMENNVSDKVFEESRRSRPNDWYSSGSFWP